MVFSIVNYDIAIKCLSSKPELFQRPADLGAFDRLELAPIIGKIESKGSLFRFLKVIDLKKRFSKYQVMDGWMDTLVFVIT